VTNGAFTVTLYPNDTASPAGTSYRVLYYPCSGPAWSEAWGVPTSAAPLKISALRATPAPTVSVVPRWRDQETPSRQVDGLNRVFTLARAPSPASSVILVRNGILQKRGLDYTLSGNAVAFVPEATPQSGDVLLAWYRY
jgi:hypothetical protein